MDIWKALDGPSAITPLSGSLYRLVESQEQVATNHLVDTLEEQSILENILEDSKPKAAPESQGLHYLLFTPFRYPPLKYGSRFGTNQEKSLFYGSLQIETALWETAYYRLIFWSGMAAPPKGGAIKSEHTVFTVDYRTSRGIKLQEAPFQSKQRSISHASKYTHSQLLGAHMREAGVEAFEYISARDPHKGINVALFTPKALKQKQPTSIQPWLCTTEADKVTFFNKVEGLFQVPRKRLEKQGELPIPSI